MIIMYKLYNIHVFSSTFCFIIIIMCFFYFRCSMIKLLLTNVIIMLKRIK